MSDVLEHARLERVRVVAITIPDAATALSVLSAVKRWAPQAALVVRSRYHEDAQRFCDAGADYVVGDEEEVGARLGEALSRALEEGSR